MFNEHRPIVGQWYVHRGKGEMFRVVALDAGSGAVAMQTFDGDVEELEAEAWNALAVDAIDPPEDWTGPYDDVEVDDLGYTETAMSAQDWRSSLESLGSEQDARIASLIEDEPWAFGSYEVDADVRSDAIAPAPASWRSRYGRGVIPLSTPSRSMK